VGTTPAAVQRHEAYDVCDKVQVASSLDQFYESRVYSASACGFVDTLTIVQASVLWHKSIVLDCSDTWSSLCKYTGL
jgi:hypothetical protein